MKVAVLQHRLLHYRTELFERLRLACQRQGIELILVHGQATRRESVKKDEGRLPWALTVRNKVWEVGGRDVLWQPLPAAVKDADLIILMQESRLVSNYPILLSGMWGRRRVAYWGHGRNFQSDAPGGMLESWKRFMLTRVDWWFAYTSMTVDILRKAGFPDSRVTQLDNAIDSDGFKADLASWTDGEVSQLRSELGISMGAPVALFCGSLYPDKRLDLMVEAADRIKASCPEFTLLVIGDGPSKPSMDEAARSRPWIKLLGVQKGRSKAKYFRLADVMFNPGLVGLHIADAFCAGLVMVTTSGARHSPEVAYLEHGRNGLMTGNTAQDYADAVVALIQDPGAMQRMQAASLSDSGRYTLDNMVQRFADGIAAALK